jgi:hypothetical protein
VRWVWESVVSKHNDTCNLKRLLIAAEEQNRGEQKAAQRPDGDRGSSDPSGGGDREVGGSERYSEVRGHTQMSDLSQQEGARAHVPLSPPPSPACPNTYSCSLATEGGSKSSA